MNEEYLSHHGIKGQKWGIRRFQNANGSLTDLGRKRYNVGHAYPSYDEMQKTVKQKSMEKAYDKALNRDTTQLANNVKNAANQTQNTLNSAKTAYKESKKQQSKPDVSHMSNKELQDAITRMNLEDNYTRLIQQRESTKSGKDYVEKTLDALGTVAQVASIAATVAVVVSEVKKL